MIKTICVDGQTVDVVDGFGARIRVPYARHWLSVLQYICTADYSGDMDNMLGISGITQRMDTATGSVIFSNGSSLSLVDRAVCKNGDVPPLYLLELHFAPLDQVRGAYITDERVVLPKSVDILRILSDINSIVGEDCVSSNGKVLTIKPLQKEKGKSNLQSVFSGDSDFMQGFADVNLSMGASTDMGESERLIRYLFVMLKECSIFDKVKEKVPNLTGLVTIHMQDEAYLSDKQLTVLLKTLRSYGLSQCLVFSEPDADLTASMTFTVE